MDFADATDEHSEYTMGAAQSVVEDSACVDDPTIEAAAGLLHNAPDDRRRSLGQLFSTIFQRIRVPDVAGTVGTQLAIFGLRAFHGIVLARLLGPHGRGYLP